MMRKVVFLAVVWWMTACPAEIDPVRVSERFGYDPDDATRFLQAALDSGIPKIVVDKQKGPWQTRPLRAHSNQTILFEDGAELVAKRGCFKDLGDRLLVLDCLSNVVLRGYGARLKMWKCDYTNAALYARSEWRHAIALYSCRNVRIEGLTIVGAGGDGVYLGERKRGVPNRYVFIRDVVCDGGNRQGISVITADALIIENCVLKNTCGLPPEDGLDFEPNHSDQQLTRIRVRNCTIENNHGDGVHIEKLTLNESSCPLDIVLEDCVCRGNAKLSARLEPKANPLHEVRGKVVYRRCRWLDERQTLDVLRPKPGAIVPFALHLEDCEVADPGKPGKTVRVSESWEARPPFVGPDGREIPFCRFKPPTDVVVRDSHPGEMADCVSPWYRFRTRFHLYAQKAGKMHVKVHRRKISPQKFGGTFHVYEVATRSLQELPPPGEDPVVWEIEAPRPGFYDLRVDVGQQMIGILAADVPIAMTGGGHTYDVSPALIAPGGSYFLLVPKTAPQFAVMAEGRDAERVTVRLSDPSGRQVDEAKDQNGWKMLFSAKRPVAGLWRVDLLKPSAGCFEDYSVDVFGIPPVSFLNAEKTWLEK